MNPNIIDEIFAGQMSSKVICKNCENISETFDPFLDLSLSISLENHSNLFDCMNSFFSNEELSDNYFCEKCKCKSQAIKLFKITKLPKILVIHLKRFKSFPKKRKIHKKITFPIKNFVLNE